MGTWTTDTSNTSSPFDAIALQDTLRENAANSALSNGITLYSQKKYAQAAKAFKQASAMNPALAQAYTYLGYADIQLGKKQDAVNAFKLSLKVDKTQDQVYSDLANLYIDLKKPADAETTLKSAIKQNNQNTLAYYTLGQLMAQREDFTDAETQFRKVIKLEPKDGNGYYALGMALNGQGRSKEAISALNTATSLKKDFVPALSELGKAYAALGDTYNAQLQVDRLNKIGTSPAILAVQDLKDTLFKPGITSINPSGSSLPTIFGTVPLLSLDPLTLVTPGASKDFTIKIDFNTDMDAASVTNIANWSITKASGGKAGIYSNGLYSAKDISVPAIPKSVTYDPVNNEARLVLTLRQNAAGNGTIDLSHLVFKFNGKDQSGKTMDPDADQIDGFKGSAF
jgi:Flp pilus assembly protein TadD